MTTQSPMQQVAERVADVAPGLVAAAHTVALQNLRLDSAAYRKRIADSHRWEAEALGKTALEPGGDMGNLIVTGDVYGSNAAEIVRALQGVQEPSLPAENQPSTPATEAIPPPATSGWTQKFGKAALVAAGLAASGGLGAGVPWLLGAYSKVAPAVTNIMQPGGSQELGVRVVPGGAKNP